MGGALPVYIIMIPSRCQAVPNACLSCVFGLGNLDHPTYFVAPSKGPITSPLATDTTGKCTNLKYDNYPPYCSDEMMYYFYPGFCSNVGGLPLKMTSLSCYKTCSACVDGGSTMWLSNLASNPGSSGVCAKYDDFSLAGSYKYRYSMTCQGSVLSDACGVVVNAFLYIVFFAILLHI
jgi:hypothetical protein